MKILSLDLLAFGPFTGVSLDLSAGREGLHVVYGPNEAGKSSALRALRALLYGIPARTTDNFLHENPNLRIGGLVRRSDGSQLAFRRRKGTKNTLLDPEGTPLEDDALRPYLGGVEEEAFSTMFGIYLEDLAAGGQELVAGGGEAGESLFAAAVGGGGLHRVLTDLDREAEELFRPRASTKLINRDVSRHKEAVREAAKVSLPGREWEEHRRALERARQERDEVARRLRELRVERNRLERILEALPASAERAELVKRRVEMGEVRILPEGFGPARREAAEGRERALRTERKALEDVARLEEELARLSPPTGLLEQGEAVGELHRRLGSYQQALRDLPGLEGEMGRLLADAEAVLKDLRPGLALETAETIRATSATRATIRELGSRHDLVFQEHTVASRTAGSLRSKIERLREELETLEEKPDPSELGAAVEWVQKQGDVQGNLVSARSEQSLLEERAAAALGRLSLWAGTLEELETLPIPPSATVDRFEAEFEALRAETRRCEDRARQARERAGALERQLQALTREGEVPTEAMLRQARARRQTGWGLVRRAWLERAEGPGEAREFDPELPLDQAYERAVAAADEVADRLRREADRVTKHANWLAQLDATREEIELATHRQEESRGQELELWKRWQALWSPLGVEPLPPREMRAWSQRAEALIRSAEEVKERREAADRLEEQMAACRGELRRALETVGESAAGDVPLRALLERGQAVARQLEDRRRHRSSLLHQLAELEAELATAVDSFRGAEATVAEWKTAWAEAMNELSLAPDATPAEAQAFLDGIQELFQKLDAADRSEARIRSAKREAALFQADVRALAKRVAPELSRLPTEQIVRELQGRVGKAREDAATRQQLGRQLREKQAELREARDSIRETVERLDALLREARCERWDELEEAERRSEEFQGLGHRIDLLEEKLLAHSGGVTVEEFLQAAARVDPDLLPERIRDLHGEIEGLESRLSAIEQRIGKEEMVLERMDGSGEAAEAAERAQGFLARMREGSERYIRLRLASSILRREMERYRARNQGPVLERASRFFAHLTIGSFAGLKIHYDESDKPILVGFRPSGEVVGVDGLSDGARDQLYLALRLATLERHLDGNEPMPFIVDDILVNFDDDRSRAAFEVLAEVSAKTQVIFFTHHAHLIDLARSAVTSHVLHLHEIGMGSP